MIYHFSATTECLYRLAVYSAQ